MEQNSDFKYDLAIGLHGEAHLSNILAFKRIEVKTDLKAGKTGNVFVEYESRGQPSGIATSQAEFYAFVLGEELIVMIASVKLKNKCREYVGSDRDVVGGDSNTSKGILLPVHELTVQ